MKRRIVCFLLSLFILLSISLEITASNKDAYNVITNPGADMATQMNVSWHSDISVTYLEYTKVSDDNWVEAKQVKGECTEFFVDDIISFQGKDIQSNGFTKRNHCKVNLIDLEPDTEYKYRIGVNPSNSTEVYYFKTGSGNTPFSFLFFTDPQYSTVSAANVFNNLVNMAYEREPDIRFSVVSGDFVDRGGKMEQWDILFSQSSLKKMPFAVTPGNHEYYDASASPKMFDSTYFNGFYNNPMNGAPGVLGSSYYFKYNNVLFVSIDSEAAHMSATYGTNYKQAQKEWFSTVMETNYAQYIVVFMHRSFYGSIYKDVSPGLRADWQGLFDKYGVDLVLTGHDHVYRRTLSVYNGVESTADYRGTTYLIGGAAGLKFYGAEYEAGNRYVDLFANEFSHKSSISLFQVNATEMKLTTLGVNGEILDEVILPAKRSSAISNFDKQTYLDSISLIINETDLTTARFFWGNRWLGHVNYARLIDKDMQTIGYDYLDTNHLGNYLEITNLPTNTNLIYTLEVGFKDQTFYSKEISLSTKPSYGRIDYLYIDSSSGDVVLSWLASLQNDQITAYRIYINNQLFKEIDILDNSVILDNISLYRVNSIVFEAIDGNEEVRFSETLQYGEDVGDISISFQEQDLKLDIGEDFTPTIIVAPNLPLEFEYSSSNPQVAIINENGKITAIGVGNTIITVTARFLEDVSASISVEVKEDAPLTPEPEQENKKPRKGCFGGTAMLTSLSTLSFIILFRRKRFL